MFTESLAKILGITYDHIGMTFPKIRLLSGHPVLDRFCIILNFFPTAGLKETFLSLLFFAHEALKKIKWVSSGEFLHPFRESERFLYAEWRKKGFSSQTKRDLTLRA